MRTRRPNDSTLDKCQFHGQVFKEAVKALIADKAFNKDKIITLLAYEGIASAIHWDYIRRKIEHGIAQGGIQTELLPLAAAFFKKHRQPGVSINALLAGPGGKAAGFAIATVEDGKIALATVQLRINQQTGARDATRTKAGLLANALDTENKQVAGQIRKTAGVPSAIQNGNGPKI